MSLPNTQARAAAQVRMNLRWLWFCAAACLLGACLANAQPALSTTPLLENVVLPTAASDWQDVGAGLQMRVLFPDGNPLFQMVTLRLDPRHYRFRAHYRPDDPLTIAGWRALLPDAEVIVNANFFHPDHSLLGMLISDGVVYGRSFSERGGTFYVDGDTVGIRSNIQQPYAGEAWQQAVQAFPMLVTDGVAIYNVTSAVRPARRTVIGIDRAGRVLLLATPNLGLGLYALAQYLPTAELDLVQAFNLDGGGSTMLWLAATGYEIRSRDAVPAVLAAYPR